MKAIAIVFGSVAALFGGLFLWSKRPSGIAGAPQSGGAVTLRGSGVPGNVALPLPGGSGTAADVANYSVAAANAASVAVQLGDAITGWAAPSNDATSADGFSVDTSGGSSGFDTSGGGFSDGSEFAP